MKRKKTPSLTLEENIALAPLVAAGDGAARQLMIVGNAGLVRQTVGDFLKEHRQYEHLRADLLSAGTIGLVEAVNHIASESVQVAAPVKYLGTAIKRAVGYAMATESTIYVPPSSRQAAYARGEEIEELERLDIELDDLPIDDQAAARFESRDLIESCCCCPEERTFVRMREAGHKLREIAEAVVMPVSSLHVLKEELCGRVLAKAGLCSKKGDQ